jgi:hypothetical protein
MLMVDGGHHYDPEIIYALQVFINCQDTGNLSFN